MLVFLSHYPGDVLDVRDGMSQRIAAIDSIFKDVERTYLHISFRGHKRQRARTQGLVRVETLNFYLHHWSIVRYLRRARFVYVHSIHNATFIAPYLKFLRNRLIVDLHGIVPEETAFLGKPAWARVLRFAEEVAVNNSRLIVVVTQRMGEHLLKKYRGDVLPSEILLLPNVEWRETGAGASRAKPTAHEGIRLIYAGTVGAWQNTDLMLRTLARVMAIRADLRACVYVHPDSVASLEGEVRRLGLNGRVTSGSLPHEQVLREYAKADAGFVLRDDILLNRVAMPTKLAEYMSYGVVPIVLSPDLGDFMRYEYRYLTIEDLYDTHKLNPTALAEMRLANFRIMESIAAQADEARRMLASMVRS